MKFLPVVSYAAAMFLLIACDSKPACNDDIAGEKSKAISEKVTEMGNANDGSLGKFLVRLQEVADLGARDDVATNGVCDAMDALLLDMEK